MSIIFVEYKILEETRSVYLKNIAEMKRTAPSVQIFEGTDQPGLFVEVWDGMDEKEFHEWKQGRLKSSIPLWRDINACIKGGSEHLHIWRFHPVTEIQ